MLTSEQAIDFMLIPVLAACISIALVLLIIKIGWMLEEREAQKRELELAGLKASHTDPKREIVV
jgi:hypothetical protein